MKTQNISVLPEVSKICVIHIVYIKKLEQNTCRTIGIIK